MGVKSIEAQLKEAGATLDDVYFVGQQPVSRNKWGAEAVRDPEDGWFASRLEHSTWVDLKRRQAAGEVSDLRRQVRFSLWVHTVWICDYIADFTFLEDGKLVVADAKGRLLDIYLMKYRLMWACYGIRVREYGKHGILSPRKFKVDESSV